MANEGLNSAAEGLGARIDDLEARIAYQDDTIERLNAAIVAQWGRLDQMQAQIVRLEVQLREAQQSMTSESRDEPPPPHY